jgi:hydroxymethylglutaryl-CoA reductase (NADPH)
MLASKLAVKNGRRSKTRISAKLPVDVRYKSESGDYDSTHGVTITVHDEGLSCRLEKPIPHNTFYAYLDIATDHLTCQISGRIVWIRDSGYECGIKLEKPGENWLRFISGISIDKEAPFALERRSSNRRGAALSPDTEKRISDRRFLNLLTEYPEESDGLKVRKFLRNKATTYTAEMIEARREWLAGLTNTNLKHLGCFSENAADFKGKIESPIGVAHVPVGVVGPLKINGDHAKGTFFVPMATTEGALITSYTFGSNIVTRSGGANVKILKDEMKSDPTFVFKTSSQAMSFVTWLEANFQRIKEIGEKTSNHLKIIKINPMINGRRVIVGFHFYTADAMGMNMAFKATDVVCKMIKESVNPEEFWLHSNINSIKKTTASNWLNGYGKTVMADVIIPRKVMEILNTTPEAMERYYYRTMLASAQGILFGASAHVANAMTAISIACGQDAALVGNTHNAILACEANKDGDLYFSIYLPSLFAATVGGGTAFGTSRECLEILGCYGKGKSPRLAEIMAATAMAGEISLMTSVVNGTYIFAHETFGRNKPIQ